MLRIAIARSKQAAQRLFPGMRCDQVAKRSRCGGVAQRTRRRQQSVRRIKK
jgi:hypothetical protein